MYTLRVQLPRFSASHLQRKYILIFLSGVANTKLASTLPVLSNFSLRHFRNRVDINVSMADSNDSNEHSLGDSNSYEGNILDLERIKRDFPSVHDMNKIGRGIYNLG